MTNNWLEIALSVSCADPDEVAGVLADEFCTTTLVEGKQIKLWIPGEGDSNPEEVKNVAVRLFPTAIIDSFSVSNIENADWLAKWKESVEPIMVGDSIRVVPSWTKKIADSGKVDVVIDPGLAFGTGHHPATEGCLVMIEKYKSRSCLDVGCGSGILAITAALLGAEKVVGVDNDLATVEVAQQNVTLNGVGGRVTLLHGSVEKVDEKFDLIVANLYLTPLVELAPALTMSLTKKGFMVVSGFTEDQAEKVIEAMCKEGLEPLERWVKDGWVALTFQRIEAVC